MRLSPMVRKSSLPSRMFASTSVDPDPEPVKRFCTMSSTLCATLASVSPVPPGACGKLRSAAKTAAWLSSPLFVMPPMPSASTASTPLECRNFSSCRGDTPNASC